MIECQDDANTALAGLLEKYGVESPGPWRLAERPENAAEGLTLLPGWSLGETKPPERFVPLLPWRSERRFVELRGLVEGQTIDRLLMCRFGCLSDGAPMTLRAVLYREFDLAEWLAGAPIVSLYASMTENRAANVIVRLANDVVCSVEAGVMLPAGSAVVDRHELIARRGVASDRPVDTQVPQSSVYTFTAAGAESYTDTDAELFGLTDNKVALVRSAFDLLTRPDRSPVLREQHGRLVGLVELAFESDRRRQRLAVEGV